MLDENMSPFVNSLSGLGAGQFPEQSYKTQMRYNSEWWHSSNLDTLVSLLNNPSFAIPSVVPAAKHRAGAYSSPTHASTMKQIDPTKLYRTVSNSRYPQSLSPSRAPSPPLPEVEWPTAAQELCKLLIPSDRQIASCTVAGLAGTKVKKEARLVPETTRPSSRATAGRQLRDRNSVAKPRYPAGSDDDTRSVRSVSRTADRRRTIAANEIAANASEEPSLPTERMRRMSIGSTVSTGSAAPSVSVRPSKPAPIVQVKKTRGTSAAPAGRPPAAPRPTPAPRVSSGRVPQAKPKIESIGEEETGPPKGKLRHSAPTVRILSTSIANRNSQLCSIFSKILDDFSVIDQTFRVVEFETKIVIPVRQALKPTHHLSLYLHSCKNQANFIPTRTGTYQSQTHC
jgi:histone deacetylase HOS3